MLDVNVTGLEAEIARGTRAILELGLVQLADREDFYRRLHGTDFELLVFRLRRANS